MKDQLDRKPHLPQLHPQGQWTSTSPPDSVLREGWYAAQQEVANLGMVRAYFPQCSSHSGLSDLYDKPTESSPRKYSI